jgi:hypothetical protein
MPLEGKNPQAAGESLPLFRPQALAEQERQHGDALHIRPLPLVFFFWLAAVIGAVALLYLIFQPLTHWFLERSAL